MSKITVKDRRAYPRHDAELALQGTPEEGGVVARMSGRNISLGGLYCTSTQDFPEMTRLSVRVLLPSNGGGKPQPLDVEAVVVRREEIASATGEDPRYEFALYFTRVEAADRERLRRFVGSLR